MRVRALARTRDSCRRQDEEVREGLQVQEGATERRLPAENFSE